jgi:hypothetical protein
MDNSKSSTALQDALRNGAIGLVSSLVLLLPGTFLPSYLWSILFIGVFRMRENMNADDIMFLICYPAAFAVGVPLGILGGYIGSSVGHSRKAATIGSIVAGILGGALMACWMTYDTIQRWAF